MKKLSDKDAEKILKERPARRFIQSVDDGELEVVFDSEIFVTEKGQEDILGFIWEKDWDKAEARVFINGEPKIYSFGGVKYSFLSDFISVCRKNNIPLSELPGHVFKIKKTGDWSQEIEYLGMVKADSKLLPKDKRETDPSYDAVMIKEIKNVIADLKRYSADLITNASVDDFVTAISIKGKMKGSTVRNLLPKLEKNGDITIKDNRVVVH